MTLFQFDEAQHASLLCGVDEAGRGPLAGDVYAAAVILPPTLQLQGLNDSKKISAKKKERLYEQIIAQALSCHIGVATVEEIEQHNILNATLIAMERAVAGLSLVPTMVLVDGNRAPTLALHTKCIIGGDAKSASIAAASILAKVARDRYMKRMAEQYPVYGFDQHKGYGTKLHFKRITEHGISPVHRRSFLKKQIQKQPPQSVNTKMGNQGEEFACRYLQQHGYTIVARNYYTALGEVDIIAQQGEILSFVEVKTRAEHAMISGGEAVTTHKQHKIKQAAAAYLMEHAVQLQPRFDVCEIYLTADQRVMVRFLPDAFC